MKVFEDALAVGSHLWYINDSGEAKKLEIKKIEERYFSYSDDDDRTVFEILFDKAVDCYERFIIMSPDKLDKDRFISNNGYMIFTEPDPVIAILKERESALIDKCVVNAEKAELSGNTKALEYWTTRLIETEKRFFKLYEEIP